MIKLPTFPNTNHSVSILDRTTLRDRIDTLIAVDYRAIQWHAVNRLSYLLEKRGNAPIVLVQITLDGDTSATAPTKYPPINITRAMSDTGVILWEYRKDNDKPAVITAWYFDD